MEMVDSMSQKKQKNVEVYNENRWEMKYNNTINRVKPT